MLTTKTQLEHEQPAADEPRVEAERSDVIAEPLPENAEKAASGKSDARAQKRRPRLRWVLFLLIVGLAVAGYWQRERLSKLFTNKATDQTASTEGKAAGQKDDLKVLYWVDPMHPNYKSDKPGKAPDCGMDLVPVYENGATPSSVPQDAFVISPEKQQLIGVTYGQVAYEPLSKTLRTVGRLAFDETKISHVHTKIEGWIEDVYVDFTGKLVEKGQPLLTIYSPDLLQTQQEYLLAIRGRRELAESSFREASAGAESLYESARRRLELWDISDEQIKDIERTGKPKKSLPLYAPAGGFVLTRNAFPKQRVMPDSDLYTIADLSTVWVVADIYEYEAPEVMLGQRANVTLTYFPGRTFTGKITYIYPQVDPTTRTLKVRIEIPNPNYLLKPDMFANVELKIDYGKKLIVPQEAVLDSGSEQTVYVALDGGYFQPRKVQLGPKVDNRYVVLGGLKAGERIVTSGNFLVDSESRLKSAAGGMGMPGMNHGGAPAGGGADHSQHQPGGQPATQAAPEDHSQHNRNGNVVPQANQEDDSQHQPKPGKVSPQPEDHSKHNPADHSQHQVAPVDHSQHEAEPQQKILYWYDPMHPNYKSDKPGTAPDCGMNLVPKYAGEKK